LLNTPFGVLGIAVLDHQQRAQLVLAEHRAHQRFVELVAVLEQHGEAAAVLAFFAQEDGELERCGLVGGAHHAKTVAPLLVEQGEQVVALERALGVIEELRAGGVQLLPDLRCTLGLGREQALEIRKNVGAERQLLRAQDVIVLANFKRGSSSFAQNAR
jgi:anti-sigma-K factor RskA